MQTVRFKEFLNDQNEKELKKKNKPYNDTSSEVNYLAKFYG